MATYNYRVKTIKMKGTTSQGLAVPLIEVFQVPEFFERFNQAVGRGDFGDPRTLATTPITIGGEFSPSHWYPDPKNLSEGMDLTDIIGVVKYEIPETAQISGDTKGPFPGFIEKTDELRAQGFEQDVLEKMLAEHEFDVTVKMDGSSGTYFLFNGEFGVCSRNQELKDTESNIFWKMARKYNIEKRMRKYAATGRMTNFAIQGEVAGPGIQSNRIGLTEVKLFVFTVQNLDTATRLDNSEIAFVLDELSHVFDDTFTQDDNCELFQMVPWVIDVPPLKTLEDVAKLSEGTFIITDKVREGIVLRAKDDPSISMKYINPRYLLKWDI